MNESNVEWIYTTLYVYCMKWLYLHYTAVTMKPWVTSLTHSQALAHSSFLSYQVIESPRSRSGQLRYRGLLIIYTDLKKKKKNYVWVRPNLKYIPVAINFHSNQFTVAADPKCYLGEEFEEKNQALV